MAASIGIEVPAVAAAVALAYQAARGALRREALSIRCDNKAASLRNGLPIRLRAFQVAPRESPERACGLPICLARASKNAPVAAPSRM